jgi:hypothetical protein
VTLNSIIARISTIALAHKQVKRFYKGLATDFLTDKTNIYPAVLLQDGGGVISLKDHSVSMRYKIFFVDLVHVSEDAKDNEPDVHSDMISIAMDLLAQMNHPQYNDWRISTDNNMQLLVEENDDLYAGVVVDITIKTMYTQNVCAVPTECN